MEVCCVLCLSCGGSGVFSTLGSCTVRGEGYVGTAAMLKIVAICFSVTVFFLQVAGWGWIGMGSGEIM